MFNAIVLASRVYNRQVSAVTVHTAVPSGEHIYNNVYSGATVVPCLMLKVTI